MVSESCKNQQKINSLVTYLKLTCVVATTAVDHHHSRSSHFNSGRPGRKIRPAGVFKKPVSLTAESIHQNEATCTIKINVFDGMIFFFAF